MLIWAIIATAVALILLITGISYRRQVRKTCRLLAFTKGHRTNLRLTASLPFRELNDLVDGINEILDKAREIERSTLHSENSLKETITNLSHDIRTPLTSLDGYFQLLSQAGTQEEREHYIAVIKERIGSLKWMLEELFTYTRLQNESYDLELGPVDFSKCVYDTAFSFYDEFQRRGIEPEISFYEGVLMVSGNREAFLRILQNIIKNALEHGRSRVSISLTHRDGYCVFCCANDVLNPDEIDINQVFTRFYKADTARTHTSTGLGLAIAKSLAEKLGAELTAELTDEPVRKSIEEPSSAPGGSFFSVRLILPEIRNLS